MRRALALSLTAVFMVCYAGQRQSPLTPEQQAAVAAINEDSLRGNLSFLSSDALEGRGTPSRGLDIAAEFIASRFRAIGLEPVGDDGYFQTAPWPLHGDSPRTKVRNVIGVLRGGDPALKQTYIIVTAHYDHLGMKPAGEGDRIYNGANDDGSGVVGVIELAKALKATHPRRSIVFMTYFGEELGDLGSDWYGHHPILPLAKTIANVNLEQIGRTDDSEGPRKDELSMTGFDYSDLGATLNKSGEKVGIKVTKHPVNSDAFFFRSDKATLAGEGVPAHTVCTAFEFPDYHQVGDSWDKIDFANEAHVLRGLAVGLLDLANSDAEPKWSPDNPRATRYLEAWQARHKG
ncbi:MAG TPA: M28 family peptidase [Fimbriimonadaceae bacterium]|nr:M28 family peptidase [Fimbriimonadaceae bacterium]